MLSNISEDQLKLIIKYIWMQISYAYFKIWQTVFNNKLFGW